MGTAAYMSPEQAEGRPADGRSDIFSVGAMLYEMATGQRAFQGNSQMATLSAVLRDEPKPVRSCRRRHTPGACPDHFAVLAKGPRQALPAHCGFKSGIGGDQGGVGLGQTRNSAASQALTSSMALGCRGWSRDWLLAGGLTEYVINHGTQSGHEKNTFAGALNKLSRRADHT